MINGGHYPGLDCGAVGAFVCEADITKTVMALTCYYLQAVGYEVLAVQENELQDITNYSNAFGADLFVSLHCNGYSTSEAYGTETYFYSRNGRTLAECIQAQIVSSLGTYDRGVKENQALYVLRYTECIAVLVELAFITNKEDERLLLYRQDDFARAVARGITDYVQLLNENS
uniref:N-acetylmuramoyl-L-alanine amidase family protein n=1 Tax=Massilibacillus massiliensis TaxID=1806837 RepID=UPI001F234AEA|nr:N-acetylmuramoyl-L-alanine amidase [Massilibacillus massiliensis]